MAWSSVVRRDPSRTDAPPQSSSPFIRPSVESLPSRQHPQRSVAVAIIDANALISSPTSTLFGLADRFVTVKEVLDEVRDPTSRFQLSTLPIDVECLQPCDEALRKVAQFARETGDLQSLSAVDLRLLALTYMLEEQLHGATHLRAKAPPLQVMQTKHIQERDLPGWGSNVQNIEEWAGLSQHADQDGNEESHILKLKNLSLDDLNADKTSNEVAEQGLHESKKEAENRDNCFGFQNQDPVDTINTSLTEHKLGVEECLQEEIIQEALGEEEWQQTVSRSTRRKRNKRARRRNTILSQSANGVESSQNNQVNKNELTTIEFEGNQCQDNEKSMVGVDVVEDERGTKVYCEVQSRSCEREVFHQDNISGRCKDLTLNEANAKKDAEIQRDRASQCHSIAAEETYSEGHNEIHVETEIDKGDDSCSLTTELNCGEEAPSINGCESEEESFMLQPLSNSSVACVTSDFPMQNVLLQIGLRVISPNGFQIRKLHRWVLKCEACRNVISDVRRIFCPKCGNGGTLYKVSVSVSPNGVTHTGRRRRLNSRGTKYSLPLPKGGRQGILENPILREDQLPKKMLRPKKKKVLVPDFSTFTDIFEVKPAGKQSLQPPIHEALSVFSGKRNPNVSHKQRR